VTKIVGWCGAIMLMIAPFHVDTRAGILGLCVGLLLVTIQMYRLKAYNMVLCNIVGISGYMFVLLT